MTFSGSVEGFIHDFVAHGKLKTGQGNLLLENLAMVKDSTDDAKDQIKWRWKSSATVAKSDFGDPTNSTALTLCVIDRQGGTPDRRLSVTMAAGGTCDGVPCWTETDSGFKLKDMGVPPAPHWHVLLKAGEAGKGKIIVKRQKASIGTPGLPFTTPVTVRLLRSDGPACWEANFGTVKKNDLEQFKAKSD